MMLWIQAWKSRGEFFKQWTWNPDTKAPDPSLPPRLSLSYVELSMQMEPHTNMSLNLCSSPVARGKCWQCTFLQTTHFILIISVFVEWCNISWLCHQVVEGMVDDVSPRPMPNCRLLKTTFWDQKKTNPNSCDLVNHGCVSSIFVGTICGCLVATPCCFSSNFLGMKIIVILQRHCCFSPQDCGQKLVVFY